MHFHIDGEGGHVDVVRSALQQRGFAAAPAGYRPSSEPGRAMWIHLDGSVTGLERAAGAVRSGWNTVLRWPVGGPANTAERLVELAEEAGVQVGILRPLRRLNEVRPLIRDDRPAILTIAVDLAPGPPTLVREAVGDVADLATTILGDAGPSRSEIESAPDGSGTVSAVAATIRYRNGALAQLFVSAQEAPSRLHLVAAGGGSVRRAVSLSPAPLPPGGEAVARDVLDFADTVEHGTLAVAPLADALEALRIAERIGSTYR